MPPVGNLSAWDVGNLYRLLDRRYRAMRPTWVSKSQMSRSLRAKTCGTARTVAAFTLNRSPGTYVLLRTVPSIGM